MDISSELLFARLQIQELQNSYSEDESELLAIREQEAYLRELIGDLERELQQVAQRSETSSSSPPSRTIPSAEAVAQDLMIGLEANSPAEVDHIAPQPLSTWMPPWANPSRNSPPEVPYDPGNATSTTFTRDASSILPSAPQPVYTSHSTHPRGSPPDPPESHPISDLNHFLSTFDFFQDHERPRSLSSSPSRPSSPHVALSSDYTPRHDSHPPSPSHSGTTTPSIDASGLQIASEPELSPRELPSFASRPTEQSHVLLSESVTTDTTPPITRVPSETVVVSVPISDLSETPLFSSQPTWDISSRPSPSTRQDTIVQDNGRISPNIGNSLRFSQATRPTSSEMLVKTDYETLILEASDSEFSSPPISSISYQPSVYSLSSESVLPSLPCVSCAEIAPPAVEMPCHHFLCRICLHRQIRRIVYKDHFAYPLRCCKDHPISDDKIKPLLPTALRADFDALAKELSIPLLERMYCSNPKCAAFLGRVSCQTVQCCSACGTFTCTRCKHEWTAFGHRNCPGPDAPDQALARLAATKKWQQCFRCHTTVEQTPGCDHIVCICGAEFCYACGLKWKTCSCPYWVEGRLVEEIIS